MPLRSPGATVDLRAIPSLRVGRCDNSGTMVFRFKKSFTYKFRRFGLGSVLQYHCLPCAVLDERTHRASLFLVTVIGEDWLDICITSVILSIG